MHRPHTPVSVTSTLLPSIVSAMASQDRLSHESCQSLSPLDRHTQFFFLRRRKKEMRLFAIVGLVALCITFTHAVHPLRHTAASEPCFPMDTPASEMCFSMRCFHLFNRTASGGWDPVPQLTYPQSYPAFQCSVQTYLEYEGLASRQCQRPVCSCRSGYDGGSCNPSQFNSCEAHTCTLHV